MRVGVIGRGVGLRLHASTLEETPGVEWESLRLPHIDASRPAQEHLDDTELSQLDGLGLIVVTSPPFAQVANTLVGLRARVPVICEKPCGLASRDAATIARAARAFDTPVAANYQLRFDPALRSWREAEATDFDELVVDYRSGARRSAARMPAWYRSVEAGGGLVVAIVSHLVDLVSWFGETIGAVAVESAAPATRAAPDTPELTVTCRLLSGRCARLQVSGLSPRDRFTIHARGRATSAFDVIQGRAIHGVATAEGLTHAPGALRSASPRPWRSGQAAMYRAILRDFGSLEGCATLTDAARTHDTLDRIRSQLHLKRAEQLRS